MKTFKIYKKRDGQNWKEFSEIYSKNRWEAKKEFAELMTQDNHNLSNNVIWLDKENDGVFETGFYDFRGGCPVYNEETEKYQDPKEVADFLLVTEKDIKKGFDFWSEDVYCWMLSEKGI